MHTVVRVDEPDPRARRPAFEPANHSQFHEIAIAIDDFAPVAPACFSANLSSRIGPFAQDDAVVERYGAWAVPKQAGLRAEAKRTEQQG